MNDEGAPLDAHLDLDGGTILYRSRGGKRGSKDARNLDYGPGLRLLLRRIQESGSRIDGVWLESLDVRGMEEDDRRIFFDADAERSVVEQFALLSRRMQTFGRPPDAPYGGSRVKTIRLQVAPDAATPPDRLPDLLGLEQVNSDGARIVSALGPLEIWSAVQVLTANAVEPAGDGNRDFRLVAEDGQRLDPNAVFEQAALINGGYAVPSTTDRRAVLKKAGFEIVRHREPPQSAPPLPPEDRFWAEGSPKFVTHLKRERAPGLSNAKKDQVRREKGLLVCERCGLEPSRSLGELGDACIEVHHLRVQIGAMREGHRTALKDLQCLCANCHRIVHAEMSRSSK